MYSESGRGEYPRMRPSLSSLAVHPSIDNRSGLFV